MYHTSSEEVTTERASEVTEVHAEFLKHWLDSRSQLNLWVILSDF